MLQTCDSVPISTSNILGWHHTWTRVWNFFKAEACFPESVTLQNITDIVQIAQHYYLEAPFPVHGRQKIELGPEFQKLGWIVSKSLAG